MSKNLIAYPLALAFALALLLVPAGDAAAQSQIPVEDDDVLACVTVGSEVWVAPRALQAELEAETHQPATIQSLGEIIDGLPPADGQNGVRFEGCFPVGDAVDALEAKGYIDELEIDPPALPSAGIALLRTR